MKYTIVHKNKEENVEARRFRKPRRRHREIMEKKELAEEKKKKLEQEESKKKLQKTIDRRIKKENM